MYTREAVAGLKCVFPNCTRKDPFTQHGNLKKHYVTIHGGERYSYERKKNNVFRAKMFNMNEARKKTDLEHKARQKANNARKKFRKNHKVFFFAHT